MKIAILGFADQGLSAYEYWNTPENEITICDSNPMIEIPSGAKSRLGLNYLEGLEEFDLLVRTPGLRPQDIYDANRGMASIDEKITSATNEFFRVCPSKNIIGVTGTKGKGTTSTLITKILEAHGLKVHLGGNIGISPLTMLKNNIQPSDWVVLELANFQLIDIKYSPHIGVCLMVVPEHLDWHPGVEEYVAAKRQMFRWQKSEDVAIYYAHSSTSKEVASASPGKIIPYMQLPGAHIFGDQVMMNDQVIIPVSEVKLLGEHNLQNVCAAITTAWQIAEDPVAARKVISEFTGLEHRLELVKEIDGVKYYDDSFGTTPETAIVAIKAFSQPKVLILGGSDKGATYNELAEVVNNYDVRHVITIGDTGPAIANALRDQGFNDISEGGQTMPEIVKAARSFARPGDILLLSTACASFGLFKNYKDRGEQFHAAVNELA